MSRWIVFSTREPKRFTAVDAESWVAARQLATGRLGLQRTPEHVWAVLPYDGETDAAAVRRAVSLLRRA